MKYAAVFALTLAACGGNSVGLQLDVMRLGDVIEVYAYEDGARGACSNEFPAVGETGAWTDQLMCDPAPALNVVRAELRAGGQVVLDQPWAPPEWPVLVGDGDEVVLITDTGDEAHIALPPGEGPIPAIDDVTAEGDLFTISWSALDAESAIVLLSGGYGGPVEHVSVGTAPTLEMDASSDYLVATVFSFGAPIEADDAFAHARIWNGNSVSRDLNAQPPN